MRKCLAFIFCLVVLGASAQSIDPQLTRRLDEYATLNKQLKFRELMEYIHPSLFKVAPKEDLIKMYEAGFENEGISLKIDSVDIRRIGPGFSHEGSEYHKVDYYMVMAMRFKDNSAFGDPALVDEMRTNFQNSLAPKKVEVDIRNATFIISGIDVLLAIKDGQKPWLFLSFDESKEALLATMIPQAVIQHFKLNN